MLLSAAWPETLANRKYVIEVLCYCPAAILLLSTLLNGLARDDSLPWRVIAGLITLAVAFTLGDARRANRAKHFTPHVCELHPELLGRIVLDGSKRCLACVEDEARPPVKTAVDLLIEHDGTVEVLTR